MTTILPPKFDAPAASAQEAIWLEVLNECLSPFDDELLLEHLLDHPDPVASENAQRLAEYLDQRAEVRRIAGVIGSSWPEPRATDLVRKLLDRKRATGWHGVPMPGAA